MYSKIKTKMVDTQWKLFVLVKMQSKFQVENVFIYYFILQKKEPRTLKICDIWAVTYSWHQNPNYFRFICPNSSTQNLTNIKDVSGDVNLPAMKRSMRNHNVDTDLCNVLADKSQQLVECLTQVWLGGGQGQWGVEFAQEGAKCQHTCWEFHLCQLVWKKNKWITSE